MYNMWKRDQKFEDQWSGIQKVVVNLLYQKSVSHDEWQDVFATVRNINWNNTTDQLKAALEQEIRNFTVNTYESIQAEPGSYEALRRYADEWGRFVKQSEILPKPFATLDRTTQSAGNGIPGMTDSSVQRNINAALYQPSAHVNGGSAMDGTAYLQSKLLESWLHELFLMIQAQLLDTAMKIVEDERCGTANAESVLVIALKESYIKLDEKRSQSDIYKSYEKRYIDAVERHYQQLAAAYMHDNGTHAYMKWAMSAIDSEENMASRYLDTDSMSLLKARLDKVLIVEVLEALHAEIRTAMDHRDIEKLNLLFKLGSRVEQGCDPLLRELDRHIFETGLAEMKQHAETIQTDCEKFVEKLLTLFNSYTSLVNEAFQSDKRFQTCCDKSFNRLVNDTSVFRIELPTKVKGSKLSPESRCPELLANYCDMLLRRTAMARTLSSTEVDKRLRDVMTVLRFVDNKDVFMRFHKAHLTRRLLLELSADDEKEENLNAMLREFGMPPETLNQIQIMFQDIQLSRTLKESFAEYAVANYPSCPSLRDVVTIKILKQSAWQRSVNDRSPLALPTEIEELYMPAIERFYATRHQGRRLVWNHHLSSSIVQFATTAGGRFDLEVTTPQAVALFAFNERQNTRLTFDDLRISTGMESGPELGRILCSLVNNNRVKIQIMMSDMDIKAPSDIKDSTNFWINQDFGIMKQGKIQRRGRVSLIGRLPLGSDMSRAPVEDEADGIVQLRVWRVQEAIMRLMKERRRLSHNLLEAEIVDVLRHSFVATKRLIKEQLEWLMANNYIKRDDKDMNIYLYIA